MSAVLRGWLRSGEVKSDKLKFVAGFDGYVLSGDDKLKFVGH